MSKKSPGFSQGIFYKKDGYMNIGKIKEYDMKDFDLSLGVNSLKERREYIGGIPCVTKEFTSEVTIWIQAYNHFEKTKRCIESVLKYTTDVDFDLILVDNNAGDETYEYFKAVDYPKKTVIHFDKNTGSAYPFSVVPLDMISKYFVLLNNDIIVTKNWLSNLLKVMKSDSKIGVVNPMSNNVSNYQCAEFPYSTYEEMQAKAANINISDPSKWQERLRVVTLGTLVSKECLYAMGWPFFDVGFSHNYMDDDMSFRARRAGYKIIVTFDTWVCHDHPSVRENNEEFIEILAKDIEKFKGKYYGIDPWQDATQSIVEVDGLRDKIKRIEKESISILGINPRCGMPILDIKNLYMYGKDIRMSAYYQEPKYYMDLCTVCNGDVVCDREENLKCHFDNGTFDYVFICEPVNMYNNPVGVIKDAYDLLSKGGQLLLSLKCTNNVISVLHAMGYKIDIPRGIYQDIQLDDLNVILSNMGIRISWVVPKYHENLSEQINELIDGILEEHGNKRANMSEVKARVKAEEFWMMIEKI